MLGGEVGDLLELLALAGADIVGELELHADIAGEILHRIDEALAQVALEERDGIAAYLAAEAVETLQVRRDVERGGLLLVKGALPFEAAAGLLQLDVAGNHRDDVG